MDGCENGSAKMWNPRVKCGASTKRMRQRPDEPEHIRTILRPLIEGIQQSGSSSRGHKQS